MKIIETDNYGGDYPDEKFVGIRQLMNAEQAKIIADALNKAFNPDGHGSRFWDVVPDDYELRPGFEP